MTSTHSTDHVSVLVVGGGPVGTTLAGALAQHGIVVGLVDATPPDVYKNASFDGRVFAFSQGSFNVLSALGLGDAFLSMAEPISDIRVSDDHSPFFLQYYEADAGKNPMGYMVPHDRLRRLLYKAVYTRPDIKVWAPEKIVELKQSECCVTARMESGRTITADLCVGADGYRSFVRQSVGIKTLEWSYGQKAVVCNITHEHPHQGIAFEHFIPSGPFACLPLQGLNSSIVWTQTPRNADSLMNLTADQFNLKMNQAFGPFLGELKVSGKRWSYPLEAMIAKSYVDHRVVLVGDAAHRIHPLAGQGLNLGIRDIAALTEVLVEAGRLGLDLGSRVGLERYQRWRRFDNLVFTGVMEGLNRSFSTTNPVVKGFRNIGLGIINRLPKVKAHLCRHAMGVAGSLPKMVEGRPV